MPSTSRRLRPGIQVVHWWKGTSGTPRSCPRRPGRSRSCRRSSRRRRSSSRWVGTRCRPFPRSGSSPRCRCSPKIPRSRWRRWGRRCTGARPRRCCRFPRRRPGTTNRPSHRSLRSRSGIGRRRSWRRSCHRCLGNIIHRIRYIDQVDIQGPDRTYWGTPTPRWPAQYWSPMCWPGTEWQPKSRTGSKNLPGKG